MRLKWDYLFEGDAKLRELERSYRETGSTEDKARYLAEIERSVQDRYLWDAYTHPLFEGILKLLTAKRELQDSSALSFAEKFRGDYRPNRKSPKARVVVRAFRHKNPPLQRYTQNGELTTELKHHLYGRINVEMEFGAMRRGYTRSNIPRKWDCEGKVQLWTWGPESDWSDFAKGTPHSRYHEDIIKWSPRALLDLLYDKMGQSCQFRVLLNRYGVDKDGNLKVPEKGDFYTK